jgi:type I restriction enzyme, S subunit
LSFPRYPSYKDSGLEWLGLVPAHWEVVPFGLAIMFQEGPGIMAADFYDSGIPLLRVSGVQGRWATLDGCNYLDPEKVTKKWDHFRVGNGDLLISASASMGTVCEVGPETAGAIPYTGIIRLSPRHNRSNKDFVRAVVVSNLFASQIELLKAGATIQHFGPTHLRQVRISLPQLDEQIAIATFLERETGKIDELVAEQRRLMELLKEKRQAVISHAVTRGLNPAAPLKPSGIEWLGDVPAHWRFGAIKHFVLPKAGSIKTGPFGSHLTSAEMQSGPIKVYNQRSVIDRDFEAGESFISEQKFKELAGFETFPGDLLVTTRGTIGRTAILPQEAERGILHPCLLRLQADNAKIRTEFLMALIQDSHLLRTQLDYLSNATTIDVIYSDTIASVVIPVPPVDEQEEILAFLEAETAKFDALTAEAQRAIDLLQERRTAVISAAVSGQIDIRGWNS